MRKRFKIAAILFFLCQITWAQGEELFDRAAKAYNSGEYEAAADLYHEILEGGEHSAAVYFNLGNSYYKLNRVGPSIYYYEKALLLDPDDEEIANNLSFARNMTLDAIEELPETDISRAYKQLTGLLTYDQWGYLAIVFMMVFVIGISLYMVFRYPREKMISFTTGMVALALMLVSTTFAYVQYQQYVNEQPAIVFAREIAVRTEPNQRSEQAFLLHEGTKVNILEEMDDWKHVELQNGQSGWMLAENLRELKDF